MPGTNFIDKNTVITAVYMNGVDAAIYDAIGDGVSPPSSQGEVKANLSLDNVDNTSDINKPISTATQTALDLKVSKDSSTGAATLPSGTTAQRPTSPSHGNLRANSTLGVQEWWNGSSWVSLADSGAFLQVAGGNQMLAPLVFNTDTNAVIQVGSTPVANITTAAGIPFMKNKLINGEVTRINQRGVVNWAAVANGAYGYDRWKKIDASNMTQIIEAGNFRPSTVHTLSGVGVTTQQITSPASGNWTLPNIPITATNVQLEEGLEATPFEVRHIALELEMCQRYCQFIGSNGAASIVGTGGCNNSGVASAYIYVPLIVPMRSGSDVSMSVLSALTNFGVSNLAGSTATTVNSISRINSNSGMVKVQVNWTGGAIVQKDVVELYTGPTTSGLVMTSEL